MEINQISNSNLKEMLANYAINILIENKMITEEDFINISLSVAYVFTKVDGVVEALYKIDVKDKNTYYFAAQNNKIMNIDITEEQYEQTTKYMFENHKCLSDTSLNETETQKARRERNNNYLKELGIVTSDKLACRYLDEDVKVKDIDTLCKKAVATLLAVQIACDINNGQYEESIKFFEPMLKKYGVEDYLNSKEKRILDGTYNEQDPIDMGWAYEIYWAICWYLGLTDDMKDGSQTCDCDKAISFVMKSSSIDDFKSKCRLRSIGELLDMQDLYFRYHWAINEKKVNPSASIQNLNGSNVVERRRGLEWIISDVDDWYDLSLNA